MYGPPSHLPPIRHLRPFAEPVRGSDGWVTDNGPFSLLFVANVSHLGIGVGASPESTHDDGVLTLTLVRDCTAMQMVSILLSMDDEGALPLSFLRSC